MKRGALTRPATAATDSATPYSACSVNILSEITEAQSNFRQISLATVTRMPGGLLVHHKAAGVAVDSRENKDPAWAAPSTSARRELQQPPAPSPVQPPVPSPAVSAAVSATVAMPTQRHSKHNHPQQQPQQQKQQQKHDHSANRTSNDTATVPTPRTPAPVAMAPAPASTDTHRQDPPAAAALHVDAIRKVIVKFLKQDEYREKISRDENKMLSERIIEKVSYWLTMADGRLSNNIDDITYQY